MRARGLRLSQGLTIRAMRECLAIFDVSLPADATLIAVRLDQWKGGEVEFLFTSKQFDELPEGARPEIGPMEWWKERG